MRIAASLGVKDEAEILKRSIDHLRAIGIDLTIAIDLGSTDGSLEILNAHRRRGEFIVIQMTDGDVHETGRWAREPAELARQAGVDWLVYLDADEFWLPRTGSLQDVVGLGATDVLSVGRYNVVLTAEGPSFPDRLCPEDLDEVRLIHEPISRVGAHEDSDVGLGWIRVVPMAKVMARPAVTGAVVFGQHDIEPLPGMSARRADAHDVVIAHLPLTTFERFERKIDNIRHLSTSQPGFFERHGWHWSRWLELADEDRLREEYERCVWDQSTIDDLTRDGVIRTARELVSGPDAPSIN